VLLRMGSATHMKNLRQDCSRRLCFTELGSPCPRIFELILDFLESAAKVSASSQTMIYSGHGYSGETWMIDIHLAACFGLQKSVSTLLDKNANVDSKDTKYRTPLSLAAENGHEAVVKLLLDKNADVESKDKNGRTPLSLAVEKGHEAVVKLPA
jgi:ankyrin repeat protein